jgi:hypothetical protein
MLVIWLYPSHAPAIMLDGLLLQLKILLVQQRFERFGKPSGVSLVPAPLPIMSEMATHRQHAQPLDCHKNCSNPDLQPPVLKLAGRPLWTYRPAQIPFAMQIAKAMLEGFDRHYSSIREYGRQAKRLFEAGDWKGVHQAVRERIPSYDIRANETARFLAEKFATVSLAYDTWQQVKLFYIGQLINHKQPELAETFFNSVCSRLLHRTYFHNDYVFARPAVSTEYILSDPPVYSSYYPMRRGLHQTIKQIVLDFDWQRPFEDLDRDVGYIVRTLNDFSAAGRKPRPTSRSRCFTPPSTATRAPTSFGKAINGAVETPSPFLCSTRPMASCFSTRYCSNHGGSSCSSRCRAPTSWSTWKCLRATCSSCSACCRTSRAPSSTPCSASASRARRCSSAT